MIKLLAISDTYIPAACMHEGLSGLEASGVELHVRPWEHASLTGLQEANLAIERGGPAAVPLPDELVRDAGEFDIVVVQFAPVDAAFIASAGRLKVIGVLRSGTENVDMEAATRRGISVLNTPGRNARAVAEFTIGMILAEVRNIGRAHADMHGGAWRRPYPNSGAVPELCGRTCGCVGYGAVARLVAGYLEAFGCRVIAYDPHAGGDAPPGGWAPLDDLLRTSDIVSLHARLTEETRHLIGARELGLMKPSAILVNTARSALVDEQALVGALSSGGLAGAAIDVFDTEPLDGGHPFRAMDNVTLTPHLAGSTADAFRNSPRLMCGFLETMLKGGDGLPVVNAVTPRW